MKNSGISLLAVVITVVVMIILASIVMSNGMDSVNEANDTKIAVEISEIKKAVADRMIEMETSSTVGMPGQKVNDIVEYAPYVEGMSTAELQDFIQSVTAENKDYFRIVDSVSAAALGVASVQKDHYFIVDYYNGKVYGIINMNAYNADKLITP